MLVVKQTKCQFLAKNCGKIFSDMVFLVVLITGKLPMMTISQIYFMVITDIWVDLCPLSYIKSGLIFLIFGL